MPSKEMPKFLHINLAIFASGSGSNAAKIMEYFRNHPRIRVGLVACNNPGAGVIGLASVENVDMLLIEKDRFRNGDAYVAELKGRGIDWIVLAGFLWKVPGRLIHAYAGHILNIHPALLPKFGGRGMYGQFVHEAVLAAGETESGITIHFVDEHYDHGRTLFQATVPVSREDTPESLAKKVQALEHAHFARVIEETVLNTPVTPGS